jgi:hypothetical protein
VQPAKVLNSVFGNGILPSGGDTKFVLVCHLIGSYLVGLPAAVLLGMFAGFNAWGVFGARAAEELIKVIAFFVRSTHQPGTGNQPTGILGLPTIADKPSGPELINLLVHRKVERMSCPLNSRR